MLKIAILASGSGSNAQALVEYFAQSPWGRVQIIVTNNPHAGVIQRAETLGIAGTSFDPKTQSDEILSLLESNADIILLAGYLRMIPANWTRTFQGRMFNIHPALLPKFGGKGMFGKHVHKAVLDSNETESGISVHYVSNEYDEGKILFQKSTTIEVGETVNSLTAKIKVLEHAYFPTIIEKIIHHEFNA